MKDGFIKAATASPKMRVGAVGYNKDECVRLAREADGLGVGILVFPELALTSYTAGDLFLQRSLLLSAERALSEYIDETAGLDLISFVGLPALISGRVYNAAAVVSKGELLALVPAVSPDTRWFAPAPGESLEVSFAGLDTVLGTDIIFSPDSLPSLSLAVVVGRDGELVFSPARAHAVAGANFIINPASHAERAGIGKSLCDWASVESRSLACTYILAEPSESESTTDGVFASRSVIAECGDIIAKAEPYSGGLLVAVCDAERSEQLRLSRGDFYPSAEYDYLAFHLSERETEIENPPRMLPFVPETDEALSARAEEILSIQSHGLMGRIERSRSSGAVIGISGGLDSTLALLVAVRSADLLSLDRKKIVAVTMPCFGTTERTKGNAERLAELLGVTVKCIDIKASVSRHFEDIGHDEENYNAVYENAQARERTQVLMDIANAEGALVVGTGDLSELALGWATYNGDHMSMYGVNAGVPKTLMRYLVSYCADELSKDGQEAAAEVLRDVLLTPVSPELLPPKGTEIAQRTEELVGPYELHDFFLYYTVRCGYSPRKILRLAKASFAGVYGGETVLHWLRIFVKRFFSQQFKRSCLPDGPIVGSVGLSPRAGFKMPSDASAEEWLLEIE